MSNDLAKSVKLVDTAETVYATGTPVGKIVWSAMSNTHVLQIDDNVTGEMLYYAKASLDNDYFEFDFNGKSIALKVTTIGSGKLLIYPYLP